MGKKKEKKKNIGLYVFGSLALAVGAMIVMPKVIDFVADQLDNNVQQKNDEDDWGPEIVRREKPEKEDKDGEL